MIVSRGLGNDGNLVTAGLGISKTFEFQALGRIVRITVRVDSPRISFDVREAI